MSVRANPLLDIEAPVIERESPSYRERPSHDPGAFAQDQICRLVARIFLPGWPKPARHVAFSAADDRTDIGAFCIHVAQTLAASASGQTCLIDCDPYASEFELGGISIINREDLFDDRGSLRKSARRIAGKLWQLPRDAFLENSQPGFSAVWLETRMEKLRMEFDYSVLRLPPAASCSEAVFLGRLSDGVILVVEANSTRRATAQRVKEMLHAGNVRILGTVLSERTFPIPERLYQKL